MFRIWACALGVATTCTVLIVAAESPTASARSAAKLAHGKYLVDEVGLCDDCHTPRDDRGRPIADKYLQGAPIGFKPIAPVPVWADKAPAIAGLPGWDDRAAIKFLMTGIAYNDLPARPPMPAYRFNKQDAEAVLAYLRSVAPAGTKTK
jgi:mono/diheme cytochrome c family protein